jgi:hypothetical protein
MCVQYAVFSQYNDSPGFVASENSKRLQVPARYGRGAVLGALLLLVLVLVWWYAGQKPSVPWCAHARKRPERFSRAWVRATSEESPRVG